MSALGQAEARKSFESLAGRYLRVRAASLSLCEHLAIDDQYHYLFNSYYYTAGQMHARPRRGLLTRPTVAEFIEYRRHVDGDVELDEYSHADFSVPACSRCGGRIKPDVVMFGESVPKDRVEDAMAAVDRTDALLIAGSSLMVFSGFRFARRAHEAGKPIAIVNRGKTRADNLAAIKVDADCGDVLSELQ